MAVNRVRRLVAFLGEVCRMGAAPAAPEPAPSPAPPPPVAPAVPVRLASRRAGLPLDFKDPARNSRQGRLEASRVKDNAEREAAIASAAQAREARRAR